MNRTVTVKFLNSDKLLQRSGSDVVDNENLAKQLNVTFMPSEFLNLGAIVVRRSEVEWITINETPVIL